MNCIESIGIRNDILRRNLLRSFYRIIPWKSYLYFFSPGVKSCTRWINIAGSITIHIRDADLTNEITINHILHPIETPNIARELQSMISIRKNKEILITYRTNRFYWLPQDLIRLQMSITLDWRTPYRHIRRRKNTRHQRKNHKTDQTLYESESSDTWFWSE